MGLGRTLGVGLIGMDGLVVDVEVDVSSGLPAFTIGGRPDPSCAQAPDRVRAAASNSGYAVPQRRVTVNLSPVSYTHLDVYKRQTVSWLLMCGPAGAGFWSKINFMGTSGDGLDVMPHTGRRSVWTSAKSYRPQLLSLFVFCLFFISLSVQAQLQLSPQAKVSLITVGPGDELYSGFGHSALWIYDPVYQLDRAYSYGTFSFETGNFYVKFLRGTLPYTISVLSLIHI